MNSVKCCNVAEVVGCVNMIIHEHFVKFRKFSWFCLLNLLVPMDLSESYRELCETLPRSQGRIVTDNFTPSGRGNSSKSAGFIFYFFTTCLPGRKFQDQPTTKSYGWSCRLQGKGVVWIWQGLRMIVVIISNRLEWYRMKGDGSENGLMVLLYVQSFVTCYMWKVDGCRCQLHARFIYSICRNYRGFSAPLWWGNSEHIREDIKISIMHLLVYIFCFIRQHDVASWCLNQIFINPNSTP